MHMAAYHTRLPTISWPPSSYLNRSDSSTPQGLCTHCSLSLALSSSSSFSLALSHLSGLNESITSSKRPPLTTQLKCLPPCFSCHPVYFPWSCNDLVLKVCWFIASMAAYGRGPSLLCLFPHPRGQHALHQRATVSAIHSFDRR